MNKNKKILISILSAFLMISLISTTAITVGVEEGDDETPSVNMATEIDVKSRNPNGEWQDVSISATTNNKIEVKLDLNSPSDKVLIVVAIPYSNDDPMLSFVAGSATEMPFFVEDSVIIWGYAGGSVPDSIEFELKVTKAGQGSLDTSVCDVDTEETDGDSIGITTSGKAKMTLRILEIFEMIKLKLSSFLQLFIKSI